MATASATLARTSTVVPGEFAYSMNHIADPAASETESPGADMVVIWLTDRGAGRGANEYVPRSVAVGETGRGMQYRARPYVVGAVGDAITDPMLSCAWIAVMVVALGTAIRSENTLVVVTTVAGGVPVIPNTLGAYPTACAEVATPPVLVTEDSSAFSSAVEPDVGLPDGPVGPVAPADPGITIAIGGRHG